MRDDLDPIVECIDCGSGVDLDVAPSYPVTEEVVLCYGCCVRRGGDYDVTTGEWTVAPKLGDLSGEHVRQP